MKVSHLELQSLNQRDPQNSILPFQSATQSRYVYHLVGIVCLSELRIP